MQNVMTQIHTWLTRIIGLAVFVQMFLAGIWHAGVVNGPEAHVFFGLGILLSSLLALLAAFAAKLPKNVISMTAILFVLILAQPFLIEQRRAGIPFLSAFHTLNAAVIGFQSGVVIRVSSVAQAKKSEARMTAVAAD